MRPLSIRIPSALARSPVALLLCGLLCGCASLTNPVADSVPVRLLPPELVDAPRKDAAVTIPLTLLGQPAPDVYRLAPGDVLGVWIEGILGEKTVQPPVNLAAPALFAREQRHLPPSFGFPIPVREDGTVALPMVGRVPVQGLSVAEAEDAIRERYLKEQFLPKGRERVIVSLMNPRQTSVVVLRQESGTIAIGPGGTLGAGKRGTGLVIDLPAYENDVLHALATTGGLPGLDAYNEVIIFRGCFQGLHDRPLMLEQLKNLPAAAGPLEAAGFAKQVIHIPLRLPLGKKLPIHPEDIVLRTGDVVFTEARDHDLFYTAGLLPPGEWVLPRDYDLTVVQAICQVKGPLVNGGFNVSNLSGALVQNGLGAPSPALLTVLRKLPGGGQVPIKVDLDRALRDPRENILLWPGDTLLLQEKPSQALARYFSQAFFNFNVVWEVIHSRFATGVINVAAPDRISSIAAPIPTGQ
jgi:protein involved in polysaccharide export with SLBB domain